MLMSDDKYIWLITELTLNQNLRRKGNKNKREKANKHDHTYINEKISINKKLFNGAETRNARKN